MENDDTGKIIAENVVDDKCAIKMWRRLRKAWLVEKIVGNSFLF